jgi:cytochrome oxidase Cu insertion factor (SCO1/SenC/PrrC family)
LHFVPNLRALEELYKKNYFNKLADEKPALAGFISTCGDMCHLANSTLMVLLASRGTPSGKKLKKTKLSQLLH